MIPPIDIETGMISDYQCVLVNHDTGAETELELVTASLTIDRKAACRRVASIDIIAPDDPAIVMPPHRIKLYAGYGSAMSQLGYLRIQQVSRDEGDDVISIEATSFERLVEKAKFAVPVSVPAWDSMYSTMTKWILEAVPWGSVRKQVSAAKPDYLFPEGGKTYEKERLKSIVGEADSMATALGVDVYCAGNGDFVIADLPDERTPPWIIPDTALISASVTADVSDMVNQWICFGDHPDQKDNVMAIAADTDPASLTSVHRWGHWVGIHSSPLYTDFDLALNAGFGLLANSRGIAHTLSITTVPNWWLDVTEPILITRPGIAQGLHLVDRVQLKLDPGQKEATSFTARTRQIQVTS